MKGFAITLIWMLISSFAPGQLPVQVDSLYTFIKYNSIHRKAVDWNQIDKTFLDQIISSKSLNDTMNSIVSVLKSLNDVHSQIFLNNQYYGHYPGFDDTTLVWLKPLNDKAISQTNQIHTEIIANKIAYIRIPSFQADDSQKINAYGQSLSDSISKLTGKCKNGIIIDLRLNGGGNLYPMLSGLHPLLGNNPIGYETDVNDSIIRTWEIKNGNFVIGGHQVTDIKEKPDHNLEKVPVVVIVGPVTRSAGSMVAIAFKGRPNTYFIGEPTAEGYTTSNGYFQFASNLIFYFATNYVADRTKKVYKAAVNPDLTINQGDNFDNLLENAKIKAAVKWLSTKQ